MLRKLYVTLTLIVAAGTIAFAQTGVLKGRVIDKVTGEPVAFANVTLNAGGSLLGAQTDFDGNYNIKPIPAGKYTIKATYVGFTAVEIPNVVIRSDQTTSLDIGMSAGTDLKIVEIVEYEEPLVNPNTQSGGTITREEFQTMASKSVNSVAAVTAGVFQSDEGGEVSIRGGRNSDDGGQESSTDYYVDGVRVRGSAGVPQSSIEQISVITGGIEAKYGDVTGGIISITTRGPQSEYFGGVELISSEFLDKFGYNFVGFNVGGPIIAKRDSNGFKNSKLGFIISGEASTERDPDPSAIGAWKVKDDVLADLEAHPLTKNPTGGTFRRSEFVTMNDLEKIEARQNVRSNLLRLNAKLDFKPTKNLFITLGGSINYNKYHDYVYENSLFNYKLNPLITSQTTRYFGRIQQKLGSDEAAVDEKSASNLKNAYFTLQGSYTRVSGIRQDDRHKDNFFNYGYIGKFTTLREKTFEFSGNAPGGGFAFVQTGYADTAVIFEADTLINPIRANYTEDYYSLFSQEPQFTSSLSTIQANGGMLNGGMPGNIYSLFYNTGYQSIGNDNFFDKSLNEQYGLQASFSSDIKNHNIQVGFEYEQRVDSRYQLLYPEDLWTIARQLTNTHIVQLDKENPIIVHPSADDPFALDTVYYNQLVDIESQTNFDRNLRAKLEAKDDEFIQTDSYSPDMYSLDMFSADELLNSGSNLVRYWGYDYKGNKLTSNPTLADYFTKQDEDGNFTREVGAFKPIYIAGYIQDKFDFRDLKFSVGVRVDRYDANQQVLKDKYSLYETVKAGEIDIADRPSNIGDDYVVYVSDVKNPSADNVVGYRTGDRWFNSEGTEILDPNDLARATATGTIAPFLTNPDDNIKSETFQTEKSFQDYDPQINFMPRIAFSFPISDVANFFAHYDVLTQRPSAGNRLDPMRYLFMGQQQGALLQNPDLKPEKTVDYELGFSQVLNESKNSALNLSAFYREMRDMVQIKKIVGAYPVDYITYDNVDFGTIKGFTAAYDLRRTNNIRLNASYTMQFADGTGSSAADGFNLASNGLPNLRTVHPLDIDQRHVIVANVDYRYGSKSEYNGPLLFGKQIFANTGANLTMRSGSGTPFNKQQNVTQTVGIGIQQKSNLKGDLGGSNMPWQFRMDLRVDKTIPITFGDPEEGKNANLGIYVQVLNVLDTRNVQAVYRYTGNPDDDGFLSDPASQIAITNQVDPESFRDLYSIKVNNPNNYSIPRRIRLGVTLDF